MKYPTIKQLRAFVAVSELKSFARGAERLHISQPALSETISQLELTIGGQLLRRTTRNMQLTPLGEFLLPRSQSLMKDLERMMSDATDLASLKRGYVDVGCLASIAYQYLPRIIARFQQQHPDITLNLRDDNAAGLFRLLSARDIDFAITSRIDDTAGIAFQPLLTDPFRMLCRADHPLAGRESVSWSELRAYFYLGWGKGTANRYAIDSRLETAGIALKPTFELSQLGTMLGMVDMGLGVAAVPFLACPTSSKYASAPLVEPEITREVGIAMLADNPPTPAAQTLMAMISNWVERGEMGADRPADKPSPTEPPLAGWPDAPLARTYSPARHARHRP